MKRPWRPRYPPEPHPGYHDLKVVLTVRDETYPIKITRRKVGGQRASPAVKYTLAEARENLHYWTEVRPDLGPGEDVVKAMQGAIAYLEGKNGRE